VPPQVNVLGTLIFLVAAGLMLATVMIQNRRAKGHV
jgi:ABC-type spermidine/putrescine transport system permease subunit II